MRSHSPIMQRRATWRLLLHGASVATLILAWLWMWGDCASPFNTSCFEGFSPGDHHQHYYSWITYARDKESHYLPPSFNNWTWPAFAPLIYGDPIPILAMLLKPLAELSTRAFQYFSLASLANLLASYICGALVAKHFRINVVGQIALAMTLSLSPIALIRLKGHEALSMQSIIIIAICWIILEHQSILSWSALLFISLGIHAYFVPMVSGFAFLNAWSDYRSRAICWKRSSIFFKHLGAYAVAAYAGLQVFGYLSEKAEIGTTDQLWTSNMNSLINPGPHSFLLRELPTIQPYQWEGFGYPGIGALAAVFILAIVSLRLGRRRAKAKGIFPRPKAYLLLMLVFLVYSWGEPVYLDKLEVLGQNPFITVSGPTSSIFRATGRYIWPVTYSLIIWSYCKTLQPGRLVRKWRLLISILLILAIGEASVSAMSSVQMTMRSRISETDLSEKLDPKLVDIVKGKSYLINATGETHFKLNDLPQYASQAINPTLKTNYFPSLARFPRDLIKFSSQDTCSIITQSMEIFNKPFTSTQAGFIAKESDAKCGELVFKKIYLFSDRETAIYEVSKP